MTDGQSSRALYAITILRGGEIVSSERHGVSDEHVFQAGSISKSVTAMVALELARQGVLELDGEVNDQLHSWHLPAGEGVTVRDLLGHTAGTGIPFYPGYSRDGKVPTLIEELNGTGGANTPPVRVDPRHRERFRYSGGGYAVAQQLICDAAGDPFDHVAREVVLDPLQMARSSFDPDPPGPSATPDWHRYPASGAAAMWTTAGDLAILIRALQHPATGLPSAGLMLAPHRRLPFNGDWRLLPLFGLQPPSAHGLGLYLHHDHHFSHFGGADGFFSAIVGSRLDGSGAVVMTTGNPLLVFRKLRAIGSLYDWPDFLQPPWKRWIGLPGLRYLI